VRKYFFVTLGFVAYCAAFTLVAWHAGRLWDAANFVPVALGVFLAMRWRGVRDSERRDPAWLGQRHRVISV